MGDEAIGGIEDGGRGAVVLFQPGGAQAGVVVAQAVEVLHPGPPPAVDGLVVVAHHEQVLRLGGKQAQPGVLDAVGVLELVHQHVTQLFAVETQEFRAVAQELEAAQEQFSEIHLPGPLAGLLVGGVDAHHPLRGGIAVAPQVSGPLAGVLAGVDPGLDLADREEVFVDLQGAEQPLEEPALVLGVEDLEALEETGLLPVATQQAVGEAVEGADPHAGGGAADERLDAPAHLGRGLVGKGHGQEAPGRGLLHPVQPGGTVHQHAGLATARTGEHQLAPARGTDGLALGIVEGVEEIGDVHGAECINPRGRPGGRRRPVRWSRGRAPPAGCG